MRRAYEALGIQCPTTTPGLLPQGVGRGVRMPAPGMAGPPGALGNVRLTQPQTQGEFYCRNLLKLFAFFFKSNLKHLAKFIHV